MMTTQNFKEKLMKYKRYGKNFRKPNTTNRKYSNCDACGGIGYFESNYSDDTLQIQRCDSCELFSDDHEAQLFIVSLLDCFKISWENKFTGEA